MSSDLPWHTFTPSGECIAMRNTLPKGSKFVGTDGSVRTASGDKYDVRRPVEVVAWPDGATPTPPADDDGWAALADLRGRMERAAIELDDLSIAGHLSDAERSRIAAKASGVRLCASYATEAAR